MKRIVCTLALIFLGTPMGLAQEANQPEVAQQEQLTGIEWLKQFEGEWATAFNGTMKSRIVGERWLVSEISFAAGVYSIQTVGYDEKKKKFIGTWVDASSNYIWHYTGTLNETGKVLILETEGPDLNNPAKMQRYRDTYEFKSANEITSITRMLDDKNQWKVFNTGKMTRKGK